MPWYIYQRGGCQIAVDAINIQDAAKTVMMQAPGAQLLGEFTPPSWDHPSMATAIVSEKRQAQITQRARMENQDAGF